MSRRGEEKMWDEECHTERMAKVCDLPPVSMRFDRLNAWGASTLSPLERALMMSSEEGWLSMVWLDWAMDLAWEWRAKLWRHQHQSRDFAVTLGEDIVWRDFEGGMGVWHE